MNNTTEQWEKELKEKQALIDQMKKDLINEKNSPHNRTNKKKRTRNFRQKEKIERIIKKYFGFNDAKAIRLRRQLARPIQD